MWPSLPPRARRAITIALIMLVACALGLATAALTDQRALMPASGAPHAAQGANAP